MSLADFRAAIPDAYAAGQSGQTIAYELAHVQTFVTRNDMLRQNLIWGFGSPQARATKQLLWFYFNKDRLVQWGRPGDWPERPDLIIEMR
jgi:hypothetical protein